MMWSVEDAFEAGRQQHTIPSTDCLELFERFLLVNRSCPQNKTLLRKHHHQPRQHVCWRRRRGDAKSRHLYFNSQFSTVQGGRGQIFVVVLLQVPPDFSPFFLFTVWSACERSRSDKWSQRVLVAVGFPYVCWFFQSDVRNCAETSKLRFKSRGGSVPAHPETTKCSLECTVWEMAL